MSDTPFNSISGVEMMSASDKASYWEDKFSRMESERDSLRREVDALKAEVEHIRFVTGRSGCEIVDRLEDLGRIEKDRDRWRGIAEKMVNPAREVMGLLSDEEAKIIPHLIDTDDNPGQRLREAISLYDEAVKPIHGPGSVCKCTACETW